MLVVLKASSPCNMRCVYCSGEHDTSGHFLSKEVCEALVAQLPALLTQGEVIDLLWHGGEPTLVPPQHFAEMNGFLVEAFTKGGYEVRTLIQSNGLHISQPWRKQMRHFDIQPGISMDGPAFLHDATRLTASGQPSYQHVAATVRSLEEEGFCPSLLCVVTRAHTQYVPEIVQWMQEWQRPVRFNPLLFCGRSHEALNAGQYFTFLRQLFTLCAKEHVTLSIQPLQWMMEAVLLGKAPAECSFSGQCAHSILALHPDGSVGTCGRSEIRYGNILHHTLIELVKTENWQTLRNRQKTLDATCAGCEVRPWCHGGCPEIHGNTPDAQDCAQRRAFFDWLGSEGLMVMKAVLLREKKQLQSAVTALQAAHAELTHV